MKSYRRCSICPKNVGHYCDECEVRIDHILYEANKLKMDYEHLKDINNALWEQVSNQGCNSFMNEEKIKIEQLRMNIRRIRDNIIKNKEIIKRLETETSEYDEMSFQILKSYDEIKKMEALNALSKTSSEPNVNIVNINVSEYV